MYITRLMPIFRVYRLNLLLVISGLVSFLTVEALRYCFLNHVGFVLENLLLFRKTLSVNYQDIQACFSSPKCEFVPAM
jgi:hypothetical protein